MKNGLFIRIEQKETLYLAFRMPLDYKEKRGRAAAYRRLLRVLQNLSLLENRPIRSIGLGFNNLGDLGIIVLYDDETNVQGELLNVAA